MKIEREQLENELSIVLNEIKGDKKLVIEFKKEMSKHGIKAGDVQSVITGALSLDQLTIRVLCLLTIKLHKLTDRSNIDPELYFTTSEIKDSSLLEIVEDERPTLPYTFENVELIEQDSYSGKIDIQELKKIFDTLLVYNFETQREPRLVKGKNEEDEIIQKPKTNPKSVNDIAELLKSGRLISSTLTFNIVAGSSDSGNDVIYNAKDRTLTVSKGAKITILDGYHRISGVLKALQEDPTLNKTFRLDILNISTRAAQNHFAQINTTNPISQSRLKEMAQNRQADYIAKELQNNCEFLKDKVSLSEHLSLIAEQLVSFKVLSDSIDNVYDAKNRFEAIQVAKHLVEFFNVLMINNPEAFITNINEIRKKSLINSNQMFYGYVLLSKVFKDKNIPLSKLKDVMDKIDFSRENKMWIENGVLNAEGNIATNPQKKIKDFFLNVIKNEVLVDV